MSKFEATRPVVFSLMMQVALVAVVLRPPLQAEPVSLQAIVTPSTTIVKDGRPVIFAVHGFIEFKSLAELFPYIESQAQRWKLNGGLDPAEQRNLARDLLHRGIESWIVSMVDERPLEALVTHTNISHLTELLGALEHKDWTPWIEPLDDDPKLYLANAYAVEFLRHNLTLERLHWFRDELAGHGLRPSDRARLVQQRGDTSFRFSAPEGKVLWGDLADLFHLVYTFSLPGDSIRKALADRHFDAVYLDECRMGFISEEFRSLMLEIWKVKYLQMPRFREVISSIPREIRLSHFLNDGDSPDIPIPIYVGYLNQIRELAQSPPTVGAQKVSE